MKFKFIPLSLVLIFTSIQAQTKNGFNTEEYNLFVKQEQHQTVTEGEDAQLTVLLSKVQEYDILVTYKVTSVTANLADDIKIPSINSFKIPAGKKTATIHIPVLEDGVSELDEEFTIEITEGINTNTNKKLNNNKLIRTRTITDRKSSDNLVTFYSENGIVKSASNPNKIEVRNLNGILINNRNLPDGIYLITAVFDDKTVSKTVIIQK